jgi:hypothetical protein
MGHSLEDVGHLELFVETNGIDLEAIETVGQSIDDVKRPCKKAALTSKPPDPFRIYQRNACSGCMNAFLLSCELLDAVPTELLDVAIGSMPGDGVGRPGAIKLGFGNCVPEDAQQDLRIPGCQPYPFSLKRALAAKRG